MNKTLRCLIRAALALTLFAAVSGARAQTYTIRQRPKPAKPAIAPGAPSTSGAGKKTAAGESFFIVGSVDPSKSQFLLKRPTEVTLLVKTDPMTKFLDDAGNAIKLADFRAGDTVWAITSGGGDEPTALRIRKGEMTIADLHRYYLDYPEIK
jgi:hypothetical protein